MKDVRLTMLEGKIPASCSKCIAEESRGVASKRIWETGSWMEDGIDVEELIKQTEEDGTVPEKLVYLDLRLGHTCNLKCVMCSPHDSSQWVGDHKKMYPLFQAKELKEQMSWDRKEFNNKWHENPDFWKEMYAQIPNLKQVYFAGGEPMLIERHYDFLERCVEAGAAKHIIVEYNTNMSTLPTRVTNLWKSFKQVRVGASVDGMEAVQEYQRSPAKWDKTLDNLRKVDALPSNIVSWLAFTVTAYNVNHMIDFMKWKLSDSNLKRVNSTNRRPIITHHVAHHPKHLNVRVLPDAYKQDVTTRFNEFLQWVKDSKYNEYIIKQAEDIVKGVTSYMNSESYYDSHWNEFLKYTKQLDSIRNENLLDVEPKFKDYING
jgi:sulfatase maturation enzyme AslB (radical SAM superfamily)